MIISKFIYFLRMKKTALLISFVFYTLTIFGQGQKFKILPLHKEQSFSSEEKPSAVFNKTTASPIWSDDFSNPANWKFSHESGTTGDWVIGTKPPSGKYKLDTINSTSKGNFALFDSDLICSGNQIAHLTTGNPIDLSAHSFVKLRFEQLYKRYYDSTFVYISTDSSTWMKYSVNRAMETGGLVSPNPEAVELDITTAAGGKSTVWIRFTFYSTKSIDPVDAGCAYSWQIDDVALFDLQDNDLKLSISFLDMAGSGYYGLMPKSQVDSVKFIAIVANNGKKEQTNVTLNVTITEKGSVDSVYNENSPAMPIPYLKGAIMAIEDPAFSVPALAGKEYEATLKINQNEIDSFPSDNIAKKSFVVTENVYARDNGDHTKAELTGPGFYYGGDANESVIGNMYSIQNTEEFGSISVYIHRATTKKKGLKIRGIIYPDPADANKPFYDPIYASNYYPVDSTLFNSWMTLPISGKALLDKGSSYLVGIEVYGVTQFNTTTGGDQVITVADVSPDQFLDVSYVYLADSAKWITIYGRPFIRLNGSSFTSVEENKDRSGIFSVYNSPNPFHKITTINYELSQAGEVKLDVYDITGRKLVELDEGYKNSGKNTIQLNASDFSRGIYFYTIRASGKSITKRMVVIE